jgi:hypothetical protein
VLATFSRFVAVRLWVLGRRTPDAAGSGRRADRPRPGASRVSVPATQDARPSSARAVARRDRPGA